VSESPLNKHLLLSAITASEGGLLFGFDTAVIAGTTAALTKVYSLTPFALGITASSALWERWSERQWPAI
jgi:SP family arabinose:H+ symporter-like MFS transporter